MPILKRNEKETYETIADNNMARKGDLDAIIDYVNDAITSDGNLEADVISEETSATGVTVDGVLNKDGLVSNAVAGLFYKAPLINGIKPFSAFTFFDDFFRPAAAAAPLAEWTVTEDDGADTQIINDAVGGTLTLTQKVTTDDDASQIQLQTEGFKMVADKEIWFETRIKCATGDATNLDFFIGLAEAEDLTGVSDNMPANGFGFHKDDAAKEIDLSTSDDGTNIESGTVHTLVDDTWVRLGFHFDGGATGSGTITPYIDGVAGTAITTATYATMVEVAPIFMLRNGDATVTQTMEIDYIYVAQER